VAPLMSRGKRRWKTARPTHSNTLWAASQASSAGLQRLLNGALNLGLGSEASNRFGCLPERSKTTVTGNSPRLYCEDIAGEPKATGVSTFRYRSGFPAELLADG